MTLDFEINTIPSSRLNAKNIFDFNNLVLIPNRKISIRNDVCYIESAASILNIDILVLSKNHVQIEIFFVYYDHIKRILKLLVSLLWKLLISPQPFTNLR